MNSLLLDLRQAMRGLRRAPGSALIAVIALGLGIGLTTMMFSIIYGALMRGLPVEQAHEIYAVERINRARGEQTGVPIHDLADWRERQRSFEDLAGYYGGTVNVSGGGVDEAPERVGGVFLMPSVLRILGVQPVLGRLVLDDDDLPGATPVTLLGYDLWQRRFGGDQAVLGRTLRANGVETIIVGVLPEGFAFPSTAQIWQPMRLDPARTERKEARRVGVIGRLKDGVSADEAMLDIDGIARALEAEYPELNEGTGARIRPFTDTQIGDEPKTVLWTMFGAVAFVLLIACANVTNLLIGRAIVRGREVGIRTSLGASRLDVALPFLAESALLASAGAILGTGIAYVGIRLFSASVASTNPPYWLQFRLDGVALVFIAVATALAAVLAGVIPAVQAARAPVSDILKDESRGASSFRLGRLSRALVIVEMALSVGLLAGAGLMIKSVIRVNTIDLGFPADRVFTARLALPELVYSERAAQQRFADDLLTRLESVPGARAIVLADGLPGLGGGGTNFVLEGTTPEEGETPNAARAVVTPGYFAIFDAAPLSGRDFSQQDREEAPGVAIVNTAFERRWFDGESALGRRFRLGGADREAPWLTIVGVVRDLRAGGTDVDARQEAIYLPFAQNPGRFMSVVARTDGPPLNLTSHVRDAVTSIDRDVPLYFVNSIAAAIDDNNWFYRVFGSLFAVFGLAALFLAGVGLYGVMAFSVGQRTRELGVRMAVGAQPADVIRMVLAQGMRQVLIGLAAGTVFALLVSRLLAAILFEVSPRDPAVFAIITTVLIIAAALACTLPALRATRVDPLNALRSA